MTTERKVAEAREALIAELEADGGWKPWHLSRRIEELCRALIAESRTPEPVAEGTAAGEPSDIESPDDYWEFIEARHWQAYTPEVIEKVRRAVVHAFNRGHSAWVAAHGESPLSESAGAKCSECGGTGEAMPREPLYPADVRLPAMCPSCHGTGRSAELTPANCGTCGGYICVCGRAHPGGEPVVAGVPNDGKTKQ